MISVPTVGDGAALVSAIREALPLEPVVFEVVDRLQQGEPDHRLQEEPGQDRRPEDDEGYTEQHPGHRPPLHDLVGQRPYGAPDSAQPRTLERQRRPHRPPHGAAPEGIEALTESSGRRIVRCRDMDMMPAIVLDVEVPIGALGEGDPAEPALGRGLAVSEFVGRIDGEGGDDPDGQDEPELRREV